MRNAIWPALVVLEPKTLLILTISANKLLLGGALIFAIQSKNHLNLTSGLNLKNLGFSKILRDPERIYIELAP